ncbi:MAG: LmbE family protein [Jatrophihabitantaceae bacterium]|nr:LmbE family protein [Jatrophihabitantaceae bacterium]
MTLPQDYFADMYERNPDPWGISGGWYEQRKRAVVMAALPRQRFRRVFEPGCANGELTTLLAQRADELVAWDAVERAVLACRAAVDEQPGTGAVTVEVASVPDQWPGGTFDLIVLSELGYYLAEDDLARLLDRAVECLSEGGILVAVHWRHEVDGYPRSGDDVHAAIAERAGLVPLACYLDEDFALDVLVATDGEPTSVARASGILT